MTEPLLLSTTRITTFLGEQLLTAATGFFFEREDRLFLVTSRHVFYDKPTRHFPDRIQLVLHTNSAVLKQTAVMAIPLYEKAKARWRQGTDTGGEIDVAVLELRRADLPAGAVLHSFRTEHIQAEAPVEVGAPLLMVGFPLGFYDTLHHLPVVRQAIIASSFGVRFQGHGYFLTDARMHRGASGAPVVMRMQGSALEMPFRLLGVHSARLDMGTRDRVEDESLGLNSAWYADILLTLTQKSPPTARAARAQA